VTNRKNNSSDWHSGNIVHRKITAPATGAFDSAERENRRKTAVGQAKRNSSHVVNPWPLSPFWSGMRIDFFYLRVVSRCRQFGLRFLNRGRWTGVVSELERMLLVYE